jgi:nicotinamide mononucleotide (NMN) deamidase PncC
MKVSVSENVAPQGIPSNPFGSFCIGTANTRVFCRTIEKRRQRREV